MVGVPPNYTVNDELRCLYFIPAEGEISRASLTELLELGEGSVRSILDDLKNKRLIESTQNGHSLTERGKGVIGLFTKHTSAPDSLVLSLYAEKKGCALVVQKKFAAEDILHLRDHAIKRGADAAIIIGKDDMIDPAVEEVKKKYTLDGDQTLVLTFADTQKDATNAALALAQQIDTKFAAQIALILEF